MSKEKDANLELLRATVALQESNQEMLEAENERLRALLSEALSITDGLDDDSYLEPEHRACLIDWRNAIKAALETDK